MRSDEHPVLEFSQCLRSRLTRHTNRLGNNLVRERQAHLNPSIGLPSLGGPIKQKPSHFSSAVPESARDRI